MCIEFVQAVKRTMPALLLKQKTHLILHLISSMMKFGPSSSFSAERYMIYLCILNKLNFLGLSLLICMFGITTFMETGLHLSRDIAKKFCVLQHLRYLCHGESERYSTDDV